MIGRTISHYKILDKLGEGGMGVVYKAQDTKLDRIVALKFLSKQLLCDEDARTRFVHEAKAASALNHPNITTIYEIDEAEGECFICMEYIDGRSLKELIKEKEIEGWNIGKIIDVGIQIAEGLSKAHQKGIVHRDIKSDNIMLTDEGVVKIMDFGLAKLKGATKVTKTGTTLGTMQYMSPEQAQGMEVDQRSDIFSFGVVLYEMVTGQLPFTGEHEAAMVYSIVNETPEPLARYKANVPERLQRIVDRALEKDRTTRYQDAADIIADLKGLQKEMTTAGLILSREKRIKSRSIVFIGITILIVVVGYATFSRLFLPSGTEPASLGRKSIAVLPFKNMISGAENEWFSDGITEDIMAQLCKIGDLKVISRTSVMLYKETEKTLRQIGEELGVATILEGSVRRADSRVRIVSQLVDAQTDEHIWAETYDRELKDIFDIQSDVAQSIASALKAKLSAEEKERIEKNPTENLTAYDYYLKGREYSLLYRKQDNEIAIQFFKKALELDPDYALAYAGLGSAYVERASTFGFAFAWWDSAIDVSQKAISVEPDCAEGHYTLGKACWAKGWLHQSLEAYQKAIDLNPNYYPALSGIGSTYWYMGKFDEALKWVKRAVALNPHYVHASRLMGWAYGNLEDYANAELWFKKALELQPDHSRAHTGLIRMYLAQRNYAQARARTQRFLSIVPDDPLALASAGSAELVSGNYVQARQYYEKAVEGSPPGYWGILGIRYTVLLAYIYWKTDRQEKVQKMLSECLDYEREGLAKGDEMWDPPYNIAAIHAIQGNKKEAYLWLQKAIDAGWRDHGIASIDPVFENLHDDEQFKQMMAEVKAMVDEMRERVEQIEKEEIKKEDD